MHDEHVARVGDHAAEQTTAREAFSHDAQSQTEGGVVEEKTMDATLSSLVGRIQDIKGSLSSLMMKLEKDQAQW